MRRFILGVMLMAFTTGTHPACEFGGGTPTIVNPTYADPIDTGWSQPDENLDDFIRDTTDGQDDSYSAIYNGIPYGANYAYHGALLVQDISIATSQRYQLSCYVKLPNGAPQGTMIFAREGDVGQGGLRGTLLASTDLTTSSDWTKFTANFIPTETTVQIGVKFGSAGGAVSYSTMGSVDNFELKVAPTAWAIGDRAATTHTTESPQTTDLTTDDRTSTDWTDG